MVELVPALLCVDSYHQAFNPATLLRLPGLGFTGSRLRGAGGMRRRRDGRDKTPDGVGVYEPPCAQHVAVWRKALALALAAERCATPRHHGA